MAIYHKANALWKGNSKNGKGKFRAGKLEGEFDYRSRFEGGEGTNPEELLGAALASCFSMALASNLEKAGIEPHLVESEAEVIMDKIQNGWTIVKILLRVRVAVSGIDYESLRKLAEETKRTCPIGKALMAIPTIELKVEKVQGPS